MFFLWRLFINRFPAKDNLKKKNIVMHRNHYKCVFCEDNEESADHVFLNCRKILPLIMEKCFNWLNCTSVLPGSISYLFLHHPTVQWNRLLKKQSNTIHSRPRPGQKEVFQPYRRVIDKINNLIKIRKIWKRMLKIKKRFGFRTQKSDYV